MPSSEGGPMSTRQQVFETASVAGFDNAAAAAGSGIGGPYGQGWAPIGRGTTQLAGVPPNVGERVGG